MRTESSHGERQAQVQAASSGFHWTKTEPGFSPAWQGHLGTALAKASPQGPWGFHQPTLPSRPTP